MHIRVHMQRNCAVYRICTVMNKTIQSSERTNDKIQNMKRYRSRISYTRKTDVKHKSSPESGELLF